MSFSDELEAAGLAKPPISKEGKFDYWIEVAWLAAGWFPTKATFVNWVCDEFRCQENRFAADVCWDIMILRHSTSGKGPYG